MEYTHIRTSIFQMINSKLKYSAFIFILVLFGCDNDHIKKKQAEALPSFEERWMFVDAVYSYDKNDELSIRFKHHDDDSEIIIDVAFKSIPAKEGTTILKFRPDGSPLQVGEPTSYVSIYVGSDALGELYVIDSTSSFVSSIEIDCIKNNKITGEFQVNYNLSDYNFPKFAPWIPDKFNLSDGQFDARKD